MVGTATAIGLGAMTLGSSIAGAMGSKSVQDNKQSVDSGQASALETQGQNGLSGAYDWLQQATNAGPGQSDVSNAYSSDKSFAAMLGDYSKGGYNPTAQDISSSNQIAGNMFAPQQTALNQSFVQQNVDADRQAALMGRSTNDPILQAKLRTSMMNQSAQLQSQQGAFAQQYALQQPMQRLGFAQQQNQMLSGLATQAMNNRQQIAAMGSGIMNNQQNWRLANATHYGQTSQTSGGGVGGAITGAMGGFGAGMSGFAALQNSNTWADMQNKGNTGGGIPSGGFGSDGQSWMNWAK